MSDCVVIGVPSDREGEVPKAFIVKDSKACGEKSDDEIIAAVKRHVEEAKSSHKWLKGGVEFLEEVPKSPSGKILRRMLRDKEKSKLKKDGGAKL